MTLLYKPDWDEATQRYRAWWAGEALDRCALWVTAPRDGAPDLPPPPRPATPHARWTDLDYAATCNIYWMSRTFYGGEAFPVWTVGYPGHTAIPAFLGCPTELDFETGWWHPILRGDDFIEDVLRLRIDSGHPWWRFAVEALRRAARESGGRCIPSIGAFGGCGDTLAALRGTDRLLYDVVDRPEQVRDAEAYLMEMWCEVYDAFYAIVNAVSGGSTCWFGVWSPGKTYAAQNDFSYMISPRMFRDLFLPVIERQTRFLDHTVYHVDGVEAFAHVPALCELPRLQAIQILPGAGLARCTTSRRCGTCRRPANGCTFPSRLKRSRRPSASSPRGVCSSARRAARRPRGAPCSRTQNAGRATDEVGARTQRLLHIRRRPEVGAHLGNAWYGWPATSGRGQFL